MQGQWCFNITMNHSYEKMQTLKEYILLSLGTLLIAVAVKEYLIPCQIVTGSVSGLALLISEVLPLGNTFDRLDPQSFLSAGRCTLPWK